MEQAGSTVQSAEAARQRERQGPASELGGFSSVGALKKAYDELRVAFTRKCQRLGELEREKSAQTSVTTPCAETIARGSPSPSLREGGAAVKNPEQPVLQPPVFSGGAGPLCRTAIRPANLQEAGELTLRLLSGPPDGRAWAVRHQKGE